MIRKKSLKNPENLKNPTGPFGEYSVWLKVVFVSSCESGNGIADVSGALGLALYISRLLSGSGRRLEWSGPFLSALNESLSNSSNKDIVSNLSNRIMYG